jgi:site-specific recombinase XerD
VTPHVFRHAAATEMVRNGAELRYVQEYLGHRFLVTT